MNKKFTSGVLLLLIGFAFSSCKKCEVEPEQKASFFKSEDTRIAFAKGIQNYFNQADNVKGEFNPHGAHFIAPFLTQEGWGVFDYDPITNALEFGSFTADLSDNDFYRENRDGTVSLHVNSNQALAEYYDNLFDINCRYSFCTDAHFDANYTGPVVTIDLGDRIIRFIDINTPTNAVSIRGNGRVRENGTGPLQSLSLKAIANGSGKVSIDLKYE